MRSSARVSPRSVIRVAAISATTSSSDLAFEATAPVQLMSPTVRKRTHFLKGSSPGISSTWSESAYSMPSRLKTSRSCAK
jgi:hypothetical protein